MFTIFVVIYSIIIMGILIATFINIYKREKTKDKILIILAPDLNSEMIFGIIFFVISSISFLLWFMAYSSVQSYLTDNNLMDQLSQLFNRDFLFNTKNYFNRNKDFVGMLKIDQYYLGINYLLNSIIYLYLALMLIFRGMQSGYVTEEGIHTIDFDFFWSNVVDHSWEEKNLSENCKYSHLIIKTKTLEDKIRLKIYEEDTQKAMDLLNRKLV